MLFFLLPGRCCKVRKKIRPFLLAQAILFLAKEFLDWVRTALFIKCHFFRWHAIVKASRAAWLVCVRSKSPLLTFGSIVWAEMKTLPKVPFSKAHACELKFFCKVFEGLFWLTSQLHFLSSRLHAGAVSYFLKRLLQKLVDGVISALIWYIPSHTIRLVTFMVQKEKSMLVKKFCTMQRDDVSALILWRCYCCDFNIELGGSENALTDLRHKSSIITI